MRGLKWVAAFACVLGTIPAFAQEGFSYQGTLQSAGVPVDGTADVQVSIWDSAAGGTQLGASQTLTGVVVAKGAFTLVLNDAAQIGPWSLFSGTPRWLELKFRTPSGVGSYTTVSPRSRMTGTPFSHATRGMTVDSNGFVGFGTSTPVNYFDVLTPGSAPGFPGNSVRVNAGHAGLQTSTGLSGGSVFIEAGGGSQESFTTSLGAGDGGAILIRGGAGGHGDATTGKGGNGGDITLLAGDAGYVSHPIPGIPGSPGDIYLKSGYIDSYGSGAGTIFVAGKLSIAPTDGQRHAEMFDGSVLSMEITDFQSVLRLTSSLSNPAVLELHSDNAGATTLGAINFMNSVESFPGQIAYLTAGQMTFRTGGVQHMTLDASGNLGLNVTPVNVLTLPNVAGTSGRGLANRWDTYSSERFKEHVKPINDPVAILLRLQGVSFDWKPEYGNVGDLGFIAERVAEVLPGLVSLDAEGRPLSMDYARIVPLTVEAIKQEHTQRASEMRQLKEENDRLRVRIEAIEKKLLEMER
ncbi:MAG: tail fiber domain-containing protein [Phycisphaerales bacterium]